MNCSVIERCQRSAKRMAVATRALLLTVVALPVAAAIWFAFDQAPFESLAQARFGPTTTLNDVVQLMIVGLIIALQIGVLVLALLQLARAFDGFSEGEPLNLKAARNMRSAGWMFGVGTVLSVILQAPFSYAVTMANGPGDRVIAVAVSSSHVVGFFAAAALIALSHIVAMAAEVREDHRQII
ncbi:MAG: hypothetical protein AAFR60_01335 [Pseudomonadota bacterium]